MQTLTVQEVCNRLQLTLDELQDLVDTGQLKVTGDGYIGAISVARYENKYFGT